MSDELKKALEIWDKYPEDDPGDPVRLIVAAARLVDSGQVIPLDQTREIMWCEQHKAVESGYEGWCVVKAASVGRFTNTCRIVSARLFLPGDSDVLPTIESTEVLPGDSRD